MIVYIVGFDTNTSFLIVWLFYLLYIRAFFPIFLLGFVLPFFFAMCYNKRYDYRQYTMGWTL